MIAKAEKFEKYLEAVGSGAFGKLEYEGNSIVLRSSALKTPERGSGISIGFDSDRAQVMPGRRFEIVAGIWRMRQGVAYRIYTNVKLAKDLPQGTEVSVELTKDAKDVVGLMSFTVEKDEAISFTVLALRGVQVEHMIYLATLKFRDEGTKVTPKAGNSSRTKKDTKPKGGKTNEGITSEKTPSTKETNS